MGIIALCMLAFGLSMDACAVAMTNGMCYRNLKAGQILSIGVCFGVMQGLMPLIGYYLGTFFSDVISAFDHYIALILLGFIGGKMLWEALHHDEEDKPEGSFTWKLLLLQGVATSIDALAVGVSFAALPDIHIVSAVLLICCITLALSCCGVLLGKRFGSLLNNKAQILGGIILIGIGIKIFAEHMWFS
ncbi:MAG: manganese efflux pump [Oscillospiraceae bacterium]|nr:manganese efflux pump [Oscillospiraceae bacterium]